MPNQYTKAARLGLPKPELSEESRLKRSKATSAANKVRYSDPLNVARQSVAMKLAVEKHPESYGVSNRGRTKKIQAHGEVFQGKWELKFYEECLRCNVTIERVLVGYPYEWNGSRKYFPDFYLTDFDIFIEVKGYETDRDLAKWKHFPHRLKVIRSQHIAEIDSSEFDLLTFLQAE